MQFLLHRRSQIKLFQCRWVYNFLPSQKLFWVYSFLLMSNKNLRSFFFLLSNIPQGVVNLPKTHAKSFKTQGYFFCRLGHFLGFDLFLPSDEQQEFETFYFQTFHRGWSTSQKHVQNPLNPGGTFLPARKHFWVHSKPFF